MRVILFQEQFVDAVRSGLKNQTIRASARCKPGDVLSLRRWTEKPYRSKQEVIREALCLSVQAVKIGPLQPTLGGRAILFGRDQDAFARDDGFRFYNDMAMWFAETHGLPFVGELIKW